jgi:hypothetical protein
MKEADSASETLCFIVLRVPDDEQSPKVSKSELEPNIYIDFEEIGCNCAK